LVSIRALYLSLELASEMTTILCGLVGPQITLPSYALSANTTRFF